MKPKPLEDFDALSLSMLANAFAKLNIKPPRALFDAIAERALSMGPEPLEGFSAQNLANLANAFAKLGVQPSQELFEAIAEKALSSDPPLEGFDARDFPP